MVIRILVPFLPAPDWKKQTDWYVVFGDWPAERATPLQASLQQRRNGNHHQKPGWHNLDTGSAGN